MKRSGYLAKKEIKAQIYDTIGKVIKERDAANFCVRTNGSMWETLHGSREEFVIGVDLAEGKDFTVCGNGVQEVEHETD